LPGCESGDVGREPPADESDQWSVSGELPEEWPDDIPIMDGLTIVASSTRPRTTTSKNELFLVASGNMDPYEAGRYYAELSGWTTHLRRFDEDPNLAEQFGETGVAVSGFRNSRYFVIAVEVVTDSPEDEEFMELGLEEGQTVVTINTGEEIEVESV